MFSLEGLKWNLTIWAEAYCDFKFGLRATALKEHLTMVPSQLSVAAAAAAVGSISSSLISTTVSISRRFISLISSIRAWLACSVVTSYFLNWQIYEWESTQKLKRCKYKTITDTCIMKHNFLVNWQSNEQLVKDTSMKLTCFLGKKRNLQPWNAQTANLMRLIIVVTRRNTSIHRIV